MRKADYEYKINHKQKVVMIIDLDMGNVSVTNDIENVIADIEKAEKMSSEYYRVYYRDSELEWASFDKKTGEFGFPDNSTDFFEYWYRNIDLIVLNGWKELDFKNLKSGMKVRNKVSGNTGIAHGVYGDRATAVIVLDITNAEEWDMYDG